MSDIKHIHPVFDQILPRKDKEEFLKQHSKVIWLTGLSGSGKSTIAIAAERELQKNGFFTKLLDGDNIRSGINNNLGFTDQDRVENIRRIAEVSKLFLEGGVITINSFVSPTISIRNLAKSIIGEQDFIEVFIDTPLHLCEKRDVKGLYKKARKGEIKDFTGISAPFEVPKNPALVIKTEEKTIEESTKELIDFVTPFIKYD